jgi:hypothetical protein
VPVTTVPLLLPTYADTYLYHPAPQAQTARPLHLSNLPSTVSFDSGPLTFTTALGSPMSPQQDTSTKIPPSTSDVGLVGVASSADLTSSSNNANLSASQRVRSTAAMLQCDAEVLAAVAKVTSTTYKLMRSMVPKPKKIEPYPIYFNR